MGTTTFLSLFLTPTPVLTPYPCFSPKLDEVLKTLAPAIDHTTRTENGEGEGLTTSTNTPYEERNPSPSINDPQAVKRWICTPPLSGLCIPTGRVMPAS